ncbi:MAG: hypothetical protein R2795_03170 [Saprospiraceae bacterium]
MKKAKSWLFATRNILFWGMQFHPESIMTPDGYKMLSIFSIRSTTAITLI